MENENTTLSDQMMVIDAIIRIRAIENLLVSKGIITKEEFAAENQKLTNILTRAILEKAQVKGNIDEIIKNLGKDG